MQNATLSDDNRKNLEPSKTILEVANVSKQLSQDFHIHINRTVHKQIFEFFCSFEKKNFSIPFMLEPTSKMKKTQSVNQVFS